jgi:hypothetical protein
VREELRARVDTVREVEARRMGQHERERERERERVDPVGSEGDEA